MFNVPLFLLSYNANGDLKHLGEALDTLFRVAGIAAAILVLGILLYGFFKWKKSRASAPRDNR